jgi:hypothetical protein
MPPLRRPCGWRDTKRSDWRDRRAAAGTNQSNCLPLDFSGPASGMAGDRGDDLVGAHRAERSAATCKPTSSSSGPSFTRSVKETKAHEPRARERAADQSAAGNAGLTELRQRWQPARGETVCVRHRLDAKRNSAAPHGGETPKGAMKNEARQRNENAAVA